MFISKNDPVVSFNTTSLAFPNVQGEEGATIYLSQENCFYTYHDGVWEALPRVSEEDVIDALVEEDLKKEKLEFDTDNEELFKVEYFNPQQGGMQITKVYASIKVTYIPTGQYVIVDSLQSQFKSKKFALKCLCELLTETYQNDSFKELIRKGLKKNE